MILRQWKSRRCIQILFQILRKVFIIPFVRRQVYLELPVIQLAVTVQLLTDSSDGSAASDGTSDGGDGTSDGTDQSSYDESGDASYDSSYSDGYTEE